MLPRLPVQVHDAEPVVAVTMPTVAVQVCVAPPPMGAAVKTTFAVVMSPKSTVTYALELTVAGLVRKGRARGRHRRRREPRAGFGELLHLDGSPHAWLALCPAERQTLNAVIDDATKRLLYAQLWPAETTHAVMVALAAVFRTFELPIALYTAAPAGRSTRRRRAGRSIATGSRVGRALRRLSIEHIGAYSPQARGRGERLNRTLQVHLINELRLAGSTTLEAANS